MCHLCLFSNSSMNEIQRSCNIKAYIKSLHPCKRRIVQIPIKTSSGCILVNNDFFIMFITVAYKTNDIFMLILAKNLQLTQELFFPMTKPGIQSLCNNGINSITILKVSFKDFLRSFSTDTIVIMEVLCGQYYIFKWNSGVVLVVIL
ncbi:hypothetical protein Hanom_Chr11g01059741 [Helianthus anomalus]